MSSKQVFNGTFWLDCAPDHQITGFLKVGPSEHPTVEVVGELTSMWEVDQIVENPDGTKTVIQRPAEHETLTGPLIVHGNATPEIPVTLVDAVTIGRKIALLDKINDPLHRLRGTQAVIGGHLSGRNHEFSGISVRLQGFDGWADLIKRPEWSSPVNLDDGGIVTFEVHDQYQVWLTVTNISPCTLRDLDRLFLQPAVNLFTLAACESRNPLFNRVQDATSNEWWDVYTASQVADDYQHDSIGGQMLLYPIDIQPRNIAGWFNKTKILGPLPSAVASQYDSAVVSIDLQALQLTTVAEGLHRALFPYDKKIDDADLVDAIRKAALDAVSGLHSEARNWVSGPLGYLADPGYGTRLKKLVETAGSSVPGVTGLEINKWVSMVSGTRNEFAHRLKKGEFSGDSDIDAYLTTTESLRWLLTGILMLEAGIDSTLLNSRFNEYDQYHGVFFKFAKLWKPEIYGSPD
jgi:hypothetical protein